MAISSQKDGVRIRAIEWDPESQVIGHPKTFHHTLAVGAMACDSTGRWIALGRHDGTVELRDLATGELLMRLRGPKKGIACLSISPDGHRVAAGSWDNTCHVWDVAPGIAKRLAWIVANPGLKGLGGISAHEASAFALEEHSDYVLSALFSSDGRWVYTGSRDGTIRQWDATSGKAVGQPLRFEGYFHSCATDRSGGKIAISIATGERSAGRVFVHRLEADGKLGPRTFDSGSLAASAGPVVFSHDGRRLFVADKGQSVRVFDLTTGAVALAVGDPDRDPAIITCLALSPDGKVLVTGNKDCAIRLWDPDRGLETLNLRGHTGGVTGLCFNPTGTILLSSSWDGTVRVWDATPIDTLAK